MLQFPDRFARSYYSDSDVATISLNFSKTNPSLVAVPIHSLRLIPKIRKKLNEFRKKRIVIKRNNHKKLAIFIPYRNRAEHLKRFIPKIQVFLKKQKINYKIFVIEQKDSGFWNKGALFNIGVRKYGKNFDYYCFHDIDLIPIKADYFYYNQPMRLVSKYSEQNKTIYKKQAQGEYNHHFGGVVSLPKEFFEKVNGFSNLYLHYGNEDDDFLMRLLLYGYIPIKDLSGYYLNLPHAKSKIVLPSGKTSKNFFEKQKLKARFKKNKKHFSMVKRGIKLFNSEGLSTVQYNLSVEKKAQSYTFCSVYLLGESLSVL